MSESLFRCHSLIRLPLKTPVNKVNKLCLIFIGLHHILQLFAANSPYFAFRVWSYNWVVIIVEKDFPARCYDNHRSRRSSFNFHYALHLFFFILTRKYWESDVKFIQNTAKRPHIYSRSVLNSKHNFRCTVKSRLDVSIKLFVFVCAAAKVYNFNS